MANARDHGEMSLRAQDIRAASGPGAATRPAYADRAVRIWLLALAIAVVAMVMVGGATRLTDSGLSITEWKPVTGALPPLSEADWLAEFEKYQQIPEYRQINKGMTLDAFKSIYWWEWGHRLLGRFVGVLFIVPFVFFLARGWLTRRMMWLTFGAFLLGGLEWIAPVILFVSERFYLFDLRQGFDFTLLAGFYLGNIPFEIVHITSYTSCDSACQQHND